MNETRRGFFGKLGAALASFTLFPKRAVAATQEAAPAKKRRWGMTIDLDRCTACGGCVTACRVENNVPIAGPQEAEMGRSIFWMDMLKIEEGHYPENRTQIMPTPCNHCENAPCTKVCPVGATFITEDGIVGQNWARCIGCRYCTTACPYTRRYFNWYAPSWPDSLKELLNPDVATRPRGVVEKCTFCHQRIRKVKEDVRAEGRELRDDDVQRLPACASSCPVDAITFGDLNDPESLVSEYERSPRAFRLQEELGTGPKVIYLREAKWKE